MDKPLSTIRLLATMIVLTTAALYAVSVRPFGGGANYLAEYLRAIWRKELMREDKTILFRSFEVNQDIIARAIDGRLSLPEAAAAMREENESRPAHLRSAIFPFHGMSLEESYLRHIIHRVDQALAGDSRHDEVLKRLWKEFDAHFKYPVYSTPARGATGCSR